MEENWPGQIATALKMLRSMTALDALSYTALVAILSKALMEIPDANVHLAKPSMVSPATYLPMNNNMK